MTDNQTKASCIVNGVIYELDQRKGFDWWFGDLDPEIQNEILDALVDKVRGYLDQWQNEEQ